MAVSPCPRRGGFLFLTRVHPSVLPPASAPGLVSRASPVQTALRNCTEMKEGPSGSAIRSPIPSHRERLW